jgi:hypothetical protein
MKILHGTILAAVMAVAVAANAETIFEAKGLVTDKTPGFRFGNVTFTDNDRVCAKFEQIDMTETSWGPEKTSFLRGDCRIFANRVKMRGRCGASIKA